MKPLDSAVSGTPTIPEAAIPAREVDVVDRVVSLLRGALPPDWTIAEERRKQRSSDVGVDALLRIRAPDGTGAVVLVEAKRLLNTRDVPVSLQALDQARAQFDEPVMPLLAARYLAPATRERIAEAGAAYADATGNLRLQLSRPALFVRDRGSDRDPWRGPGRPRGTLQGPPAARVVRALVDFAPPMTVPELAERARTSTGATYRVVAFAEEEELLKRRPRGPIVEVRWRRLLERWSRDYGFAQSNTVERLLEPRGLDALIARLQERPRLGYAVTGSLAAERRAAYAPARLAMIYVANIADAVEQLGLRTVEAGANVVLATGDYDVAFERTDTVEGVRYAAASQVAVDLLTGPGRNPSEGAVLLDWMEANEPRWRQ